MIKNNTVSPPLAVSQRDALRRHLKLDHGRGRARVSTQCGVCCLGDGLGAGQGLGLHRVQVEDVTGWEKQRKMRQRAPLSLMFLRSGQGWNNTIILYGLK